MRFRLTLVSILTLCILSLNPATADSVRGVFAVVLYQHAYTQPVGSGAASANITVNCGGAAFSQCGWENLHNGSLTSGVFDNLQSTPISQSFPGSNNYMAMYDNVGSNQCDRLDAVLGTEAPLLLQACDGYVGVGIYRAVTSLLTVGGSITAFDPTSLASTSLTNGTFGSSGTSWTATNDCSFPGTGVTCAFSSGTASTITQTSGTLAIPGHGNRVYKITYTVSGVTGTPTATFTSAFFNGNNAAHIALNLINGAQTQYFMTVATPANFVISTTLTTGQAFTLTNMAVQEVVAGNNFVGGSLILGNCSSGASPAVCGSYTSGVVAIPTGVNPTLVVDTTLVGPNSRIILTPDDTEAPAGTTCNTTLATLAASPVVTARSNAVSFTISYSGTISTNPVCVNYLIVD